MAQPDKTERAAGDDLLLEWSRTRGPLFDDPRVLVCRFFAVIMAGTACDRALDAGLRIRAARVLEEALARVPGSHAPATREKFARATALIADVRRLTRAHFDALARGKPSGFSLELRGRLHKEVEKERARSEAEFLRSMALAELLAAALGADDGRVQLRAARSLLARTRDAARRVGRERPQGEAREQSDERARAPKNAKKKPGKPRADQPDAPAMPPPASGARPAPPAHACSGTSPP